MAVKRALRLVAFVDDRAVTALDHDAQRLKHRPFVLADEIHRQHLPFGADLQTNLLEYVRLALNVPEGPSDGGVNGDRGDFTPPVQAAVRGDGTIE
jgi:hypothetical protein